MKDKAAGIAALKKIAHEIKEDNKKSEHTLHKIAHEIKVNK